MSGDLGLTCKNTLNGTRATFNCRATREEILSATNDDEMVVANMNYKDFVENMKENDYTCVLKKSM